MKPPIRDLVTECIILIGNINSNDSGTHDWTIDIPTSVLGKTAKYVLRFKDLNPAFNPESRDVSSPAFLVITGDSSSSSRTSSSSSTITSSPKLSSSAVSSTQASTPPTGAIGNSTAVDTTYKDKYTKLSGGLTAGIAVASVVVLCAVLGLVYFLYKRRKNKRDPATEPSTEHPTGSLTKPPTYQEAPKQQSAVPSEKAAELGTEERPVELEALQSGCELGDFPLDIMFHIMGELGWAGSVCLGLTCPPPLCREPPKSARVELFKLLGAWHGDQYTCWAPNSPWGRIKGSNVNTKVIPARFLRKSVYDITPLDNTRETIARNTMLRYNLGRSYQDYFWFRTPRINQKNIDDSLIAWPPGWLSRENDPESAFRMSPLPNPYNMGLERWEKEATKVILSTIDVARDRRHWRWYWKNCLLFRRNYASFQEAWAERQAEIVSTQTHRRLGDLPLEIIYNVMGLLGWEGSTCLGLTCPELYDAYRALYPSKVPLRSLVDTTLPFRLYPVTQIEMTQLYPPIELYKLVGNWNGLKNRYLFWKNDLCWKRENTGCPTSMTTALDVPSSGVPDRFLLPSDYEFTRTDRTDHTLVDYDEDISVHLGSKEATLLLQASRIPFPFNLGAEWDSKAKKLIVESINLAPCAGSWQFYWKSTNIWQRNTLYFDKKWKSAEAAEKALDHFPEWIEMIGF
ncbi:hypothetical protein BPAE_0223g00160 [Botrytis paeoniae]|uniref:Uncharacterized protein n=1 Tax=Botrytis paeoniae TaxID=278948 RepID=A0A4Z1FI80_9HELO|nr:hypothetical protein BPAE_0223g00160 [Botrytis paeoniae]